MPFPHPIDVGAATDRGGGGYGEDRGSKEGCSRDETWKGVHGEGGAGAVVYTPPWKTRTRLPSQLPAGGSGQPTYLHNCLLCSSILPDDQTLMVLFSMLSNTHPISLPDLPPWYPW